MNILGTGLSGLVGSRVLELLSPRHAFENLSLETGFDITNKGLLESYIEKSSADWIFHFAAKTDVDGCEQEKSLGIESSAWKINVVTTEHIVSMCQKTGKRLLYISTDYVFDGTKDTYAEEDQPHPQSWYAITKYEGEKRVQSLGDHGLVIRIANPYRSHPLGKLDFVHKIIERLSQGLETISPDDQLFIPTFIDDIAHAIDTLIHENAHGIYHVVGSQAMTPYDSTCVIAQTYSLHQELVKPAKFSEYFAGRASRPFHAVLLNDKITRLGIIMSGFDEGLRKVRSQE